LPRSSASVETVLRCPCLSADLACCARLLLLCSGQREASADARGADDPRAAPARRSL
jgi:hypothetical protein